MRPRATALAALAALPLLALAGCFSSPAREPTQFTEGYPRYEPANDLYHFEFLADGEVVHFDFAPGALGKAWNKADESLRVALPEGFLPVSGDNGTSGSFSLETEFDLAPGEKRFFLAPPSAGTVSVLVEGQAYLLDPTSVRGYRESETQLVSGETVWELSAFQQEQFPHRTPGQPNYARSIDYFADYFRELGYEVEVDPYGLRGLSGATGCPPGPTGPLCPESLANVVAMKPGTEDPSKVIFVAGGHFDMVPQTTHAAFDDTSGTVATMELARALAPYDFRHTIAFGLWGGEENGILGSQFWVQSHPQMRARILSYWNLDVVGMSWPAPLVEPDPIVIATGPDAPAAGGEGGGTSDPVSQSLLGWAQTLQRDWFAFPEEAGGTDLFHYEGVASGQASGYAAVNAQSDHTPFMGAGIPSYFIFNGDALSTSVGIHDEADTLANMTKYSLYGPEFDLDQDFLSPEDFLAGKQALADSWETVMMFPLYHALLVDLGLYTPPAAAAQAPAGFPPA